VVLTIYFECILERDHFQNLNVDVSELLKWTFKRKYVRFFIGLSWLIHVSINALASLWLQMAWTFTFRRCIVFN